MKLNLIPVVAMFSLMSPVAFAQVSADNFKGFNLSLGASVQQSLVETRESGAGQWSQDWSATGNTPPTGTATGNFSYNRLSSLQLQGKVLPEVELGYNWKWSEDLLLGLSIGADFGKKRSRLSNSRSESVDGGASGTIPANSYTPGGNASGTAAVSWTVTPAGTYANSDRSEGNNYLGNRIFIALKPSIAVSDATMLFLKFSYNQARARLGSESLTIRGAGFGAGFESNLSKDWFLRGEIEAVKMSGDQYLQGYSVTANGSTGVTLVGSTANQYSRANFNVASKDMSGKIAIGYRF